MSDITNTTNSYKPSDSPFLAQVRQILRLRHMSRSTEKNYLYYILDYIYFYKKLHPQEMGVDEIRSYLTHLAVQRNVAASTQPCQGDDSELQLAINLSDFYLVYDDCD